MIGVFKRAGIITLASVLFIAPIVQAAPFLRNVLSETNVQAANVALDDVTKAPLVGGSFPQQSGVNSAQNQGWPTGTIAATDITNPYQIGTNGSPQIGMRYAGAYGEKATLGNSLILGAQQKTIDVATNITPGQKVQIAFTTASQRDGHGYDMEFAVPPWLKVNKVRFAKSSLASTSGNRAIEAWNNTGGTTTHLQYKQNGQWVDGKLDLVSGTPKTNAGEDLDYSTVTALALNGVQYMGNYSWGITYIDGTITQDMSSATTLTMKANIRYGLGIGDSTVRTDQDPYDNDADTTPLQLTVNVHNPVAGTDQGVIGSETKFFTSDGKTDITNQMGTYAGHGVLMDQKLSSSKNSDMSGNTYVINTSGQGFLNGDVKFTNDAGDDVTSLMKARPIVTYYDSKNNPMSSYKGATLAVISNLTLQAGKSFHIKTNVTEGAGDDSWAAAQLFSTFDSSTQSGKAINDASGNPIIAQFVWHSIGSLSQNAIFTDADGNDISNQSGVYKGNAISLDHKISNSTKSAITGATYFVRTTGTATFAKPIEVLDASGKDIKSLVNVAYYDVSGAQVDDYAQANRAVITNVTVPLRSIDSSTGLGTPGSIEVRASYKAGTTKQYATSGALFKTFSTATFSGDYYTDVNGANIDSGVFKWAPSMVTGNINYVDTETNQIVGSTPYTASPGSAVTLSIPDKYIQMDGKTSTFIPAQGGDVEIDVLALTEAAVTNPNPAGEADEAVAANDTTNNNGRRVGGFVIHRVPSYSVMAGMAESSVDLTANEGENEIQYTNLRNVPVKLLIGASALTIKGTGIKLPVHSIMVGSTNIYADGHPGNGVIAGTGTAYKYPKSFPNTLGDTNPIVEGQHVIKLPKTVQMNMNSQYLPGTYTGIITYSVIEDNLN